MYCPLCKNDNLILLEKIVSSDIIKLYLKKFKFNVDYLFKSKQEDFFECTFCCLRFFAPFSGGDEKFYEHFQKYDWYYMDDKNEYDFAAQYIRSTDKVLEIGSGKGAFATKIFAADYVGLEFSKAACDLAASQGVKVLNESIEKHAFDNREKYDVVCCFQVLEHVDGINSFLQASVDCLKIGGKLIVSVPSGESFFGNMVNAYLNLPPHHASRWSDYSLNKVAMIFNLNLEVCYHENLAPIHRLFYARSLIENFLREKIGMKFKIVDMSVAHKLIQIIAFMIAKFNVNTLVNKNNPVGHSVVAVYKKI